MGTFGRRTERIVHGRYSDRHRSQYNKSAAQVVLRWHLQHGIVAIPKSVHRQRMEENFNIEDFMLTPEDMTAIASMNTGYNTILDLHAPEEVQRLYDIECPA